MPAVSGPTQEASRAEADAQAGPSSAQREGQHPAKQTEDVPPPPTAAAGSTASEGAGSSFECNICLETPHDPVVTLCGHLFCWACLYRWLRVHAQSNECPVCKAGVEEDKVVPLYGRGKAQSDPRKRPVPGGDVPNRPNARRPEPVRHARPDGPGGFGLFPGGPFASAQIGGFTVSAGFGLFPALFGWHFQAMPGGHQAHPPHAHGLGPAAPGGARQQQQQQQQQMGGVMPADDQNAILSKLLLVLGVFVMLAIVFS